MRISNGLIVATMIGLALGLAPTMPFDGSPTPESVPQKLPPMSPAEAMRSAAQALKGGDKARAVMSLQYAAEHGNEVALWQLGHMYAKGNGVPRDDYRAFEYFQKFADRNANTNPGSSFARYVADAFVALGNYYLTGIPSSPVIANASVAQRMFTHAASYFGDPQAQYQLGRLLLEGNGVDRDPRRAVQWLNQAANKRHYEAQALLGRIQFNGEVGKRDPASGLMWLIVAYDGPGASVPWIAELHDRAFKEASEKDRAAALVLLERWMERGQR
jgi:uncharacterized protein